MLLRIDLLTLIAVAVACIALVAAGFGHAPTAADTGGSRRFCWLPLPGVLDDRWQLALPGGVDRCCSCSEALVRRFKAVQPSNGQRLDHRQPFRDRSAGRRLAALSVSGGRSAGPHPGRIRLVSATSCWSMNRGRDCWRHSPTSRANCWCESGTRRALSKG